MSGLPSLPPQLAGRFTVERVLASGGFGAVFLARQTTLERRVALKLLHEATLQDESQVKRFELEAKVTASFDHPHIVRVIDHGVDGGLPWIAYELLEGRSLADLVAARALTTAQALDACAQIASALDFAHTRGVLHRDIKAANVMESVPGHYKVTDFGIARWTTGERVHTRTGTILGTPSHLAPEVIQGDEHGPPADVYALGILAFEALAGQLPFRGANFAAVLAAHVQQQPPPLNISKDIDAFMLALLAKDPAKRPGPAGVVARRFAELCAAAGVAVSGPRRVTGRIARPRTTTSSTARMAAATITVQQEPRTRHVAGVAALACALLAVGAAWRLTGRPEVPAPPLPPSPAPSASSSPEAGGPDWDIYAGMARIPAGKATIGGPHREVQPVHEVNLSAYRIDRYEVTNREFRRFLESPAGRAHRASHPGSSYTTASPRLPVVFVDWHDANAYCRWTRRSLPTEAQWERAARGPRGASYPWGEDYDASRQVNAQPPRGSLAAVDERWLGRGVIGMKLIPQDDAPGDVTSEGVRSMAGSASEWVGDWAWPGYYRHCVDNRVDLTDPPGPSPDRFPGRSIASKVKKGSSFEDQLVPAWRRRSKPPQTRDKDLGFRCACLEKDVPAGL